MKSRYATTLLLLAALVFLPSCARSKGEVWEDSKTCGRHIALGLAALAGRHTTTERVESYEQFSGPQQSDFIPLRDEDLTTQIVVGDFNHPQSQFSPGEGHLPGIEAFMNPTHGELADIFARIRFETDDYTIRGKENLKHLKSVADYLTRHPEIYVFVEGHCDERGADAYNLALGARRSNSVRNYLVKNGVNLNRLFTVSYGKEKPLAMGHDAGAWQNNRRAQFKIYEATS